MRIIAFSAAALLALGLAGCSPYAGSRYSTGSAWGYGDPTFYHYGPSRGFPFGFAHPYRSYNDRFWYARDRDPLSQKQVLRGLERRGYSDFEDFDKRRGAYFVEARDRKGREVVVKINKHSGRVVDTARE